MDNSTVQQNVVYSNAIGIRAGDQGYSPGGTIANNVIYANSQQGFWSLGRPVRKIVNNTIYQPVGDAVRVQEGPVGLMSATTSSGLQPGYDLFIDPSSQVGLQERLQRPLHHGGGPVGSWQGSIGRRSAPGAMPASPTRTAWFVDPLFVDPTDPISLLGFRDRRTTAATTIFICRALSAAFTAVRSRPSWIPPLCCRRR